jgi:hypothetical protein
MEVEPSQAEDQGELSISFLQGAGRGSKHDEPFVDADQERDDVDEDVDIAEDSKVVLLIACVINRSLFLHSNR